MHPSGDPEPHSANGPRASASGGEGGSRIFPGWRWVAVALAFPVAGLLGRVVGGDVDGAGPALIGGAITGAGLGVVQWLAAKDMFGRWPVWVGASAVVMASGSRPAPQLSATRPTSWI